MKYDYAQVAYNAAKKELNDAKRYHKLEENQHNHARRESSPTKTRANSAPKPASSTMPRKELKQGKVHANKIL